MEHWYPARAGEVGMAAGGKVLKEVVIPPIIKFYRMFMGGVDLFDQFRAYFKLELKSLKYWPHVLVHCGMCSS